MKINSRETQTKEKLRGGYYTPKMLTDFISRIIFNLDNNFVNGLEPSLGDGAFFESISEYDLDYHFTGIEIDIDETEKALTKFNSDKRFDIINTDFYEFYHTNRDSRFDVIVGNPPYIRYQFLSELQREYQSEILLNNNMKSNKLINSWVAFTVASIELLEKNGILAFVLPTDLLQVSYAKQLRHHFKKEFSNLTIINIEESSFPEIQQDILIILGQKKDLDDEEHQLRIININNSTQLDSLNIEQFPVEDKKATHMFYEKDKWTTAFIGREHQNYYFNLKNNEDISQFNNYIKGEVGITTGNNKIFAINDAFVNEFKLDKYTIPLLGRSVEASGITYRKEDLEFNRENDKNIWLLDFNNKELSETANDYIQITESNNEHLGYKLQLRDKWYEVPSIWIPDAFLLRRMGSHPKVVRNCIDATSTDTFHRLTFYEGVNIKKIIFALYSSLSLMSFELEGRVFGGGALEILPGDLKNIYIVNLDFYSNDHEFDLLFNTLDKKFRAKEDILDIVMWVDNILVDKGYNSEVLNQSYDIWQNIRNRRINK